MPATNFHEYARGIEDVLDATVAAGYDNAAQRPPLPQVEHKHTPAGVEVRPAPTLAQVVDEIIRGMQA